jgi:hypothetical protein
MWTARLSRREVLELMLSANEPARDVLKSITGVVFDGDPAAYHAFWTQQPGGALPLPELLVVPDGTEGELLVALNASPHAPSPMTSLTRVLTGSEAHALFRSSTLEGADDTLPSAVALAMVEAVVLSDGRVPLRQVTPALCKRTLSFAWGKALAASSPAAFMEKLPSRWIEAYGIVNSPAAVPGLRSIVSALVGPLGSCAQLGLGLQPAGPAGKLAHACLRRDRLLQERAWAELAQRAGGAPSLDSLASATREERGSHLQQMLKLAPPSSNDDSMAAACAFLATQVAPGSLEHFDVLRGASNPSVAFWYALYASLQTPSEILSGLGGLGLRVIRDVSRVEEPVGRPTADIAFSEVKALERVGIDVLGRKFGHLSEVEVELIPFVTSSFSFHARSARARNDVQAQLPLEEEAPIGRGELSAKAKLRQAVAYLNDVLRDLPDSEAGEQVSRRSSQSLPKRSRAARDRD